MSGATRDSCPVRAPTVIPRFVLVLGALCSLGRALDAQAAPSRNTGGSVDNRASATGTIDGLVTDSALVPIAGSTVSILQTSVQVETTTSGRFRILQIPAGQYLIVVRKVGFRPASGIIEVGEGETLKLTYTLDRVLTTLDTMRVVEQRVSFKLAEFEQRRRLGEGHFITQDDIERRSAPFTTDLVRGVLGFQVVVKKGTPLIVSMRAGCTPDWYVDGIRQFRPPSETDLPSPKEIAGLELYSGPASAPLVYGKVSTCGLLLIWTRSGQ